MNQLFAEIARFVGFAVCLQLYGLVHTLAANYATDENKAKKIERDGFFSSHTWKVALGGAVFFWVLEKRHNVMFFFAFRKNAACHAVFFRAPGGARFDVVRKDY